MQSLNQFFLNMSVRKKLLSGFAIVLIILLGISLLSFLALNSLNERFSLLLKVKTISLMVSDARQQEKNFMLRNDESYLVAADKLIEDSLEIADSAISAFNTDESRALMQTLRQQAQNYQQELKNYATLGRTSQRQQQQLEQSAVEALRVFNQLEQDFRRQATEAIASQAEQSGIDALQYSQLSSNAASSLLEARRLERIYISSRDTKDYQALQLQLTQLDQLITQLMESGNNAEFTSQLTDATNRLAQYRAEFTQFRQVSEQASSSEQQLTEQARSVVNEAENSLERQLEQLQIEDQQLKLTLLFSSIFALVFGLLAAVIITRAIVNPLQQVVNLANSIADGDLTANISSDRQDELGKMITAMQRMTVSLRHLIQKLSSGIAQLASSTEEMAVISQQTSAGVSQQKIETEQVATAMNEMTATVQDVARSAEDASDAATLSAEQAELSNRILDKTMTGIKRLAKDVNQSATSIAELKEEASSIGAILDVITSITDQTNLLALNAAIEAARAGEAGRGFSVVADEVRQLANRAQKSTTEIAEVIKRLQQKTDSAVISMAENTTLANEVFESTDDATDAIENIIANIRNIQMMNQQIAAAALQQSTVAEEINRSLTNIQEATEQSSVAIEETARTSSALSQLGLEQQQLVNQFRLSAV